MKSDSPEHKLISAYLKARKRFVEKSKEFPSLQGNDNIIGTIGEFIALQYYKEREPSKARTRNQAGWDIKLKGGKKVSVRMITSENKNGRTTPIKFETKDGNPYEWDELMVILLTHNRVDRIGFISRSKLELAKKKEALGKTLVASRSFFNPNGLFNKFGGRVISDFNLDFN